MNDVTTPKDDHADALAAWRDRVAQAGPAVEAAAHEADRARRLSADSMAALHEQGLFRLLLPRDAGGAEVRLPLFFAIVEALAKFDASAAWCVCQGNGCAMMGAFLDAPVAREIWADDPHAVLAWGPGKAEAVAEDDGYRVTAQSFFVSGGRHATWLGAHCAVVESDGAPRLNAGGVQENRTAIFPAGAASFTDNWDVVGLRGTGSDPFTVEGLLVPADHTLVRATMIKNRRVRAPLYVFTQTSIYAMGFAATALGIARGVIDAFVALAQEKKPRLATMTLRDNPAVHDEVARAEARLSAARAFLLDEIEAAWREAEADEALTIAQRMRVRLAATHAIQEAKGVVDMLYDTSGTSAIMASSPFERRFRDIHAVALQIQGRKTHYQTVGAWLLGHSSETASI